MKAGQRLRIGRRQHDLPDPHSEGSSCRSSTTGANRSPRSSTRRRTSAASNTSAAGILELLPVERRRHRRALARPQRVDAHGRLVLVVLAPVDQHLAAPQLLLLLGHDQLRMRGLQMARKRLREQLGAVVVVDVVDIERHVHLDALRARGLREALEADLLERVAQYVRHLAALGKAGGRTGIEVEGHDRRPVDVVYERERGVELEIGEVGQPDQRRQVVADAVVDLVDTLLAHPLRRVRGAVLLIEVAGVDAVRIALERQRAVAQVRKQDRRDTRVVVDHLALGEPRNRVEHLAEVGEGQRPALDLDLEPSGAT